MIKQHLLCCRCFGLIFRKYYAYVICAVGCLDDTFTKSGFSNRENAPDGSRRLGKHAKLRMHLLERVQNFKSGKPINFQLNEAIAKSKEDKRVRGIKLAALLKLYLMSFDI